MPPRLLQLIAVLCLLSVAQPLSANLYVPFGTGTTLAPVRNEDIVMVSERVLLEENSPQENFRVTAMYTMRNDSDRTIVTHVAFPFRETRHDALRDGNFGVTVADATGVETQPSFEVIRPDELEAAPYDFGVACVWPVTWAPRETNVITLKYTVGETSIPQLFVAGWRLSYVVNTGAFWKGPIGKAEFIVRFKDRVWLDSVFTEDRNPNVVHPGFSYPENIERLSDLEVCWQFENWVPTDDLWIGQMRWVGFDEGLNIDRTIFNYREYKADKLIYNDALLEGMAQAALTFHRIHFPEQARRFHPQLKAFHAKRLYHEILARNGDPFYLGKETEGQPAPADAFGTDENDNYVSVWSDHFERASFRQGGWYEPGTGRGPHGTVLMEDLTAIEQQNLNFLKTYFDP